MRFHYAAVLWLRQDLRILDNPALFAAVVRAQQQGGQVAVVFISSQQERALVGEEVQNVGVGMLHVAT